MKTISVIVPVYFNEGSLPPLYNELRWIEQKLQEMNLNMELIFVNDGSSDGSYQELQKIKELRPATKVIKLTKNFGAVHASWTGFSFVTGDAFTILAADLQDPPDLIIEMTEKWLAGSKFVVSARRGRHDPIVSKLFAGFYYWLVRAFVVSDYPNGGYDMALMDKVMLPYMINSSKNFNTPLFAYWLGFKPTFIYYDRRQRQHGKSQWKFSKRVNFFLDGLLSFSIVPIRIISMIGLIVSIVSFTFGLSVVINRLLGNVPADAPGFSALASLISFLLGMILVMLGIIGEYIWRIFDEVNKRPESVIEEVL